MPESNNQRPFALIACQSGLQRVTTKKPIKKSAPITQRAKTITLAEYSTFFTTSAMVEKMSIAVMKRILADMDNPFEKKRLFKYKKTTAKSLTVAFEKS